MRDEEWGSKRGPETDTEKRQQAQKAYCKLAAGPPPARHRHSRLIPHPSSLRLADAPPHVFQAFDEAHRLVVAADAALIRHIAVKPDLAERPEPGDEVNVSRSRLHARVVRQVD